jgi:hypothetical protein
VDEHSHHELQRGISMKVKEVIASEQEGERCKGRNERIGDEHIPGV